jgi:hypothetical protein
MDWPPEHTYEDTRKVDKLTKLLCEAVQILEDSANLHICSDELQAWAKEHVKTDKKRLEAERAETIKNALEEWQKKLTPKEKKLMGLK